MINEYNAAKTLVEEKLASYFSDTSKPQGKLLESMRYSLLAGGKRIRPVLVMKFCEAVGGDAKSALPAACGVEMLHTYSLIHDDLPCMDNDDLRRGKPTNHVVYGETVATLAGDALQAEAFKAVLSCDLPADRLVKMAKYLADGAGESGICGGQVLDMLGEGKALTEADLTAIHGMKTASLLETCCKMGAAAGGGNDEQIIAAGAYAKHIGLAFQILDDVLDETSTTETLGKPVGSDSENGKTTFATLYGVDKCMDIIHAETDAAVEICVKNFPNSAFLQWFARFLAERNY